MGDGRRAAPLTLFQDYILAVLIFFQTPQRPVGRQTGTGFYIWKQLERPLISPFRQRKENTVPAEARAPPPPWLTQCWRLPRQMSNSIPAAARGGGRGLNRLDDESPCAAALNRSEAAAGLAIWRPRACGLTQATNNLIEKDGCCALVIRLRIGADPSAPRQRRQI